MSTQDLRMQVVILRKQMVKLQNDAKEREDKLMKTLMMIQPFLEVLSETQLRQLGHKVDEIMDGSQT